MPWLLSLLAATELYIQLWSGDWAEHKTGYTCIFACNPEIVWVRRFSDFFSNPLPSAALVKFPSVSYANKAVFQIITFKMPINETIFASIFCYPIILYVQEVVTLQKNITIYLHKKIMFTPFFNYYNILGWLLFVYRAK